MTRIPDDPLAFIQRCVREGKIIWTYHVNMRLEQRHITRQAILEAVDSYAIVESYSEDKYLPSYLIVASGEFHLLFAVDAEDDNVRMVTAYRPDSKEWNDDFTSRREKE